MEKQHFAIWYNPDAIDGDKDNQFIPICDPLRYYNGNNYVEMYNYDVVDCKKCIKTFNNPKLFKKADKRYMEAMG